MHHTSSNRILSIILTLVIIATLLISSCITAFATYSGTINLANVRKNESGDGFFWNNPKKVLTIEGLDISTTEDFGLKLPAGATVEIKGTNYIKAGKYGIGCTGNVTFQGDGTLIIESEDTAIYSYSSSENHKIRFAGGKYKLSGKNAVIRSEAANISVTGGTFEITSDGDYAIDCRTFSMTGGTAVLIGAIHTTHQTLINGVNLEITASSGAAIVSDNLFEMSNIKVMTGDSGDALAEVENYDSKSCFVSTRVSEGPRSSVLFGEDMPITVDYILLAVAILLTAAAIVVPILRKRYKTKKLYEGLAAEKAE